MVWNGIFFSFSGIFRGSLRNRTVVVTGEAAGFDKSLFFSVLFSGLVWWCDGEFFSFRIGMWEAYLAQ
jgi:hypothetical protein